MILRGADGDDGRPVGQREETGFLAGEKLFDHDFAAGAAEPAIEHLTQRFLRLFVRFRDDHALACGETVGLEHEGRLEPLERAPRRLQRGAAFVPRGGDAGALAQFLGEALASFELSGLFRGAEGIDPGCTQRIGQPVDQRRFGADHDEVDGVLFAKPDHCPVVGRIEGDALGILCDARVARCRPQLVAMRRLRQFPRQRMFAPAAPEQKDIHGRRFPVRFR